MADKRTSVLLVTLLLASTLVVSADTNDDRADDRDWIDDPGLRELIQRVTDNVTQEFIHSKIENLTAFGTRYTHSEQNPKAAEWIAGEFEAMGYDVERWGFTHQGNNRLKNIIATKPGTDPGSDGYYIICAHLDSTNWPESWSFPETLAPGADDDATGIATILAAAKVLRYYEFKHDIRFIAFNAEELTRAVGSTRYAENASVDGDDIIGVLNVDMTGYNDDYIKQDVIYRLPSYHFFTEHVDPVNLQFQFIDHLFSKKDPETGSSWGDNEPFQDMGYLAISFVESLGPRDDSAYFNANVNYHSENDTIDKLNMELVTRVARLVTGTLVHMNEPTLPDLVLEDIVVQEEMIFEDEEVQVNGTISNKGNLNATDVRVDLVVDGIAMATKNVTIPISGSTDVCFLWNATPGDHVLNISVDPLNVVGEWDDGDNDGSVSRSVWIRPDVQLQRFELLEDRITSGETAHLTVKVHNTGPTDIELKLYIYDDLDGPGPFTSEFLHLGAGEDWDRVYEWTTRINGTHVLKGVLSDHFPLDRNESNNMLTDTIYVNGVPEARIIANPSIGAKTFEDIRFSAIASSDDVGVEEFKFTFGDGNETDWIKVPEAKHNYSDDGAYTTTVVVRDGDGAVSEPASVMVTVDNRPPVVKISVDRPVAETNSPITFYSTGSYDLDGRIISYNWTFTPNLTTSTKADPKITFSKMDTYQVLLILVDDDGAVASARTTVSVTNRLPTAVITGPKTAKVGEGLTFSGLDSYDVDGYVSSHFWDFGDGTVSAEQEPVHAYHKANNYTITLTVTDNKKGKDVTTFKVLVIERQEEEEEGLSTVDLLLSGVFAVILIGYMVIEAVLGPPRLPKRKKDH